MCTVTWPQTRSGERLHMMKVLARMFGRPVSPPFGQNARSFNGLHLNSKPLAAPTSMKPHFNPFSPALRKHFSPSCAPTVKSNFLAIATILVICGSGCDEKQSLKHIQSLGYEDRMDAVKKVHDQALLAEIAINENYPIVEIAIAKLTDQSMIATVALHGKSYNARYYAIEKLTNQTVLANIAIDFAEDSKLRMNALKRLTDQTLLAKACQEVTVGPGEAEIAISKLTDQALLAEVAFKARDENIKLNAIVALDDRKILEEGARDTTYFSSSTRKACVVRLLLTDPVIKSHVGLTKTKVYESVSIKGGLALGQRIGTSQMYQLQSTGKGETVRDVAFSVNSDAKNGFLVGNGHYFELYDLAVKSILSSLPPIDAQRVKAEYRTILGSSEPNPLQPDP